MKVVIVGAGIGGLVCALACRLEGLDVTVLERVPALAPIGAGIQIPPNATRVARQLGVLPKLIEKSVVLDSIEYVRYADGKFLFKIEGGEEMEQRFGEKWMVISRYDYHEVLWNAAKDAGAHLVLDSDVESIDFDATHVVLKGGEIVKGDVIVGADGLWSRSRDQLLGKASPPTETGDLAYRGTLSRNQLESLHDPQIDHILQQKTVRCWMGPNGHCVFYPIDCGQKFNLVLLRPDNLSKDVKQAPGDVAEMRAYFDGWDSRLTKLMAGFSSILKWKLWHHEELESWTKGAVALLGDASHPTLPYQAQGAAMAVEDGAVLAKLLGLLNNSVLYTPGNKDTIASILQLYESLRKTRTTTIVQGANSSRVVLHLPDGPLQEKRDAELLNSDRGSISKEWLFANQEYLHSIFSFDSVKDAVTAFKGWQDENSMTQAE